jgi:DNA-binding PucR family transcriptional regulator
LCRAAVRIREHQRDIEQIGVSAKVEGLGDLVSALRAAQLAAAVDNGSVTMFDDLGPYGSLVGELAPGRARELIDKTLGPLLSHDETRSTRLVETLKAYVDHSGRIQAAAASLRIHPNTMHQRLRRIAQLVGVDIHDYRSLGSLVLALEWDRMMRARETSIREPA